MVTYLVSTPNYDWLLSLTLSNSSGLVLSQESGLN